MRVSTDTVQLVQLTDLHLLADPDGRLKGVATLASLRATLRAAAADLAGADAIVLSGDLVQDQPAAYAHLPPLLTPLGLPVLCIPGNHDLPSALATSLQQAPFQVGGQHDVGSDRTDVESCHSASCCWTAASPVRRTVSSAPPRWRR